MNKKVIKTIEKIEECSIEEAVNKWLFEALDSMRRNIRIDLGDVGFLLSVDEMIDLIARNGNKE